MDHLTFYAGDPPTIRTSELPTMPIEPQRGADHEYLSRLYLNSLVFVLSQTPEQQVNDVVVYKNRDRLLFAWGEEEKRQVTLTVEFNRSLFTLTDASDGRVTIPAGWIGSISLGATGIHPARYPVKAYWTPEEAVASLINILHNEEKVRTLYKEAQDWEGSSDETW